MLAILLAGICGISAISLNEFRYTENLQTDSCNVCYYLRCYTMDKARCIYYNLASDITRNSIHGYESTNEIIGGEVDDLMFEYTEKASNVAVYKDCIPFISQYTNCNRDNMCVGCKTCNCDGEGRWNCSSVHHCRPDHEIPLNHHTLVVVMENLNDYKSTITNIRRKRSVGKDVQTMSHQEVLKWMYGVKRFDSDKDFPNTTAKSDSNTTNKNAIENSNSILSSFVFRNQHEQQDLNESESKPLVFEDLLNNLNMNDDKVHSSLEDKTPSKNKIEVEQPKAFNETSLLSDTTILDDDYQKNKSDTDVFFDDVFAFIEPDINDNFNYKRDVTYNTRRLDKRDVALQSVNVTSIPGNNTDKVNEIQDILYPLHNIVLQRQEELNQLIDIKEKLVTFIKTFSDINFNTSVTTISNENTTNLYVLQLSSIQNFVDFRKRDPNANKYLQKLKKDIHEVLRDIAVIQRFSNYSAIPYDLKILIRAMKNYVKKENELKKINNAHNKNTIDFRKRFDLNINKTDKPIDDIINILEVLDNDMPTYNVLNLLTPETRKVLTRIINTFYRNNLTTMNSHINRSHNFTANLEDIGKNWNQMTIDIATISSSERLYSMRLFYLVLTLDIRKIEDALAVLQFAENRRMIIDDIKGETIVERIAYDLRLSNRRFHHVMQRQTLQSQVNDTSHGTKLSKKKSILQHIKTLLKNSKMDIRKLLHRKVPKSQIVKHIAKKKRDEIRNHKVADYEETMQRWQNNLNIISRNKRAAGVFNDFINSIKTFFSGHQRSHKKKSNKTTKLKKHLKRGPKKTRKITSTTKKTKTLNMTKHQQK